MIKYKFGANDYYQRKNIWMIAKDIALIIVIVSSMVTAFLALISGGG